MPVMEFADLLKRLYHITVSQLEPPVLDHRSMCVRGSGRVCGNVISNLSTSKVNVIFSETVSKPETLPHEPHSLVILRYSGSLGLDL